MVLATAPTENSAALESKRSASKLKGLTPNWFASVMGTGIVAVAAIRLPEQFPGARGFATTAWLLAALLLLFLLVASVIRARRHTHILHRDACDAVMSHFYGAAPMALLTVGAATLLVGPDLLGLRLAIDIDWVLWFAGTFSGLVTAATVPFLTFTRHRVQPDSAFGGWLMPVVPPMVSASTGALLLPYAQPGQVRLDLLLCCYGMFGLSLIASMVIITLIWHSVALHGPGEVRMVPTLWIVLGPLGQSVTAANLLGVAAHLALPQAEATIFRTVGIIYGLPVIGFAAMWAVIAGTITLQAARSNLPFSLTWWSFTFPIGTCATGMTALALATGSTMMRVGSALMFGALVAAWFLVAVRTGHGLLTRSLPTSVK